jgi:hypothetical protein
MNESNQKPVSELAAQVLADFQRQLAEAMPADPLAVPGVVRVLLSPGVSRVLQESGEDVFMIAGKASYPATPDRWCILLKPVPKKLADEACGVLLGSHKAVKIKTQPAAAPATKTAAPAYTP